MRLTVRSHERSLTVFPTPLVVERRDCLRNVAVGASVKRDLDANKGHHCGTFELGTGQVMTIDPLLTSVRRKRGHNCMYSVSNIWLRRYVMELLYRPGRAHGSDNIIPVGCGLAHQRNGR